jgi:hypothetical protein
MVKKVGCVAIAMVGLILWSAALLASTPATSAPNFSLKPSLFTFQNKQKFLVAAAALGSKKFVAFSNPVLGAPKSKARAFLQSLILPGWGQHYAESRTMMKAFIASEAALLGSYLGFTLWSNWLEDDYRTFASTHAGVNPRGKPRDYFVDIGNFNDIFDYNQEQLRNRDVRTLYPVTDEFFWRWDREANRLKFEDLRVRSARAANRADLTLAVIFVNHLLSAIHSTLAVHKYNRRLSNPDFGVRVMLDGYTFNEWRIRVEKNF